MKKDLGHGWFFCSYIGIQNLLVWKRGVEDPFNVMAAAAVTFGVRSYLMNPGSFRFRIRNMALTSVQAAALGFPIGWIQVKTMEMYRATHPHPDQREVKSGVGMESLEENLNK